jgi:hypothetical protein
MPLSGISFRSGPSHSLARLASASQVGSTGPEVLGVTRSDEVNWRDSNNRDRCLVQQDGLPHRCWVTVKTALPRGIAEHRYRFCATVLLFCEHSPAIALTPRTEK